MKPQYGKEASEYNHVRPPAQSPNSRQFPTWDCERLGDYSLAAYPPIFPGKNLKTKKLNGILGWEEITHSALLSGYQIRAAFPRFWENSISCGIRWLGGIGENFRLTRLATGAGFMLE
jgi:hypothetical protein